MSTFETWRAQANTETDTQILARALATCPQLNDAFIELRGELGAGKTTLTRHLLQALGVTGRVKSPTYALAESYDIDAPNQGSFTAWHFDFYRFDDPSEWLSAGFRDAFAAPGLKVVEWAEKARSNSGGAGADGQDGELPGCDLLIELIPTEPDTLDDSTASPRQIVLTAQTPTGLALLTCARNADSP